MKKLVLKVSDENGNFKEVKTVKLRQLCAFLGTNKNNIKMINLFDDNMNVTSYHFIDYKITD